MQAWTSFLLRLENQVIDWICMKLYVMGEEVWVGWFELNLSNSFNRGDLNQFKSYVDLLANFLDKFI